MQTVKVTEREERDWSEDESLLGLQTSKPPPPGKFEVRADDNEPGELSADESL